MKVLNADIVELPVVLILILTRFTNHVQALQTLVNANLKLSVLLTDDLAKI